MPVRHDVHRSCGSAFLADETASNRRPSFEAGYPVGRRPCVDRSWPNIGCCRSHDRRRSISPEYQAGNCLSIVRVAARPLRMISQPAPMRKLSIPWGSEQRRATSRRGLGDHSSSTTVSGSLSAFTNISSLILLLTALMHSIALVRKSSSFDASSFQFERRRHS